MNFPNQKSSSGGRPPFLSGQQIGLLLCVALLFPLFLHLHTAQAEETSFVYGQSERGRDLTCFRLGKADAENRFLMVFGVHGYEDVFPRDGGLLCDIAGRVCAFFEENPSLLNGWALYIVPLANPDGLLDGIGNNTFGRLNALNLDIARDFPTSDWKKLTTARYKTGDAPLATREAQALAQLIADIQPACGADVHGFVRGGVVYAGKNDALASVFADAMEAETTRWSAGGQLCGYLDETTQGGLLIELPLPLKGNGTLKENYASQQAERLCRAVIELSGGETGVIGE